MLKWKSKKKKFKGQTNHIQLQRSLKWPDKIFWGIRTLIFQLYVEIIFYTIRALHDILFDIYILVFVPSASTGIRLRYFMLIVKTDEWLEMKEMNNATICWQYHEVPMVTDCQEWRCIIKSRWVILTLKVSCDRHAIWLLTTSSLHIWEPLSSCFLNDGLNQPFQCIYIMTQYINIYIYMKVVIFREYVAHQ